MPLQQGEPFLDKNDGHVLCTDGTFYGSGSYKVAPALEKKSVEKIFRHKGPAMLLRRNVSRGEGKRKNEDTCKHWILRPKRLIEETVQISDQEDC